jgi:ribonuclease BN (tRNA processing enzyme)
VEADGYRLLLDCGNGSLANLLQVRAVRDLDAILLSHRHPDHWADVIGIILALAYDPAGRKRVPLYGPRGLDAIIGTMIDDPAVPGEVCPYTTVRAGDRLELGPFDVRLYAANHPVETLLSRLTANGKVLAYSADSDCCEDLAEAAREADLFIADCTWPASAQGLPPDMHMRGADAGRLAAAAGARRLLVTHVWPSYDPEALAVEAAAEFHGITGAARDLQVLDV